MSIQQRRKYDRDFKKCCLLTAEPGRTVVNVVENLGVGNDFLHHCRREYHNGQGKYVFPGNGKEGLTEE